MSDTQKTTRYLRGGKSIKQMAEIVGVRPRAIRRLIDGGELRAVRVSPRIIRILAKDGNDFLTQHLIPPKYPPK